MRSWRFYVYALMRDDVIVYIGKGSGDRLKSQRRRYKCDGHEIARFKREDDAYTFERHAITEHCPELNCHPGGNGSRVQPIKESAALAKQRRESERDYREMHEMGTRRWTAKFLLSLDLSRVYEPSKVDEVRCQLTEVLNGPRC